jgi:hypothetical protein
MMPDVILEVSGGIMKPRVTVFWALAGAAMLFGCTQDPAGKAPGGLEPSPSSQQSGESRSDNEPGGRSRGGSNGGSGGGY